MYFSFTCVTLSKCLPSVDGLSESRTVGGESDLYIFVMFHDIYLSERGGGDKLVGIVLL